MIDLLYFETVKYNVATPLEKSIEMKVQLTEMLDKIKLLFG